MIVGYARVSHRWTVARCSTFSANGCGCGEGLRREAIRKKTDRGALARSPRSLGLATCWW